MGSQELIIITVVIVVLFGGSQIPKLCKGIGEGIKELRNGVKEEV